MEMSSRQKEKKRNTSLKLSREIQTRNTNLRVVSLQPVLNVTRLTRGMENREKEYPEERRLSFMGSVITHTHTYTHTCVHAHTHTPPMDDELGTKLFEFCLCPLQSLKFYASYPHLS